ncbi:hypothetical protein IV102_11920 [bacterium]|nr:hypothetical protein [bacterium]
MAVSILAVALLGTAAALHYGMQAVLHGSLMTEASTNARAMLEVMLAENRAFSTAALPDSSSGYNDAPGVNRNLNAPPFNLADYRFAASSRYQRHIETHNYTLSSDGVAAQAWKDDVRQVSVTVLWSESSRNRSLTLRSFCRRPR